MFNFTLVTIIYSILLFGVLPLIAPSLTTEILQILIIIFYIIIIIFSIFDTVNLVLSIIEAVKAGKQNDGTGIVCYIIAIFIPFVGMGYQLSVSNKNN